MAQKSCIFKIDEPGIQADGFLCLLKLQQASDVETVAAVAALAATLFRLYNNIHNLLI